MKNFINVTPLLSRGAGGGGEAAANAACTPHPKPLLIGEGKKGFTLVELSIVLVIIGLLVGGILVGQNLIDSAKLSRFIASIGKHDAAINAFEAKYRGLPGDHKSFGGNGDGFVGRNGAWVGCGLPSQDHANMLQGEIANYWSGIYPGEYLASPYAPNSNQGRILINNPNFKKYFPIPDIGIKGSFLYVAAGGNTIGSAGPPWCIDNITTRNYYILSSPDNYRPITEPDGGVFFRSAAGQRSATVIEMMGIDIKIDDRNPIDGNVRAGSYNSTYIASASVTSAPECSSGVNYLLNNKGYQCIPLIRVGTVSGNLK